jgi:glutamate:Na+ symporter, ESS family
VALVALLIGRWVGGLLVGAPVTVPDFLVCLVAGLVLANAGRPFGLPLSNAATELVGSVALEGRASVVS